jgi:NAD(P)-dependent dehydrogenase (short-subunit alcohol dehydrogenase family)
MELNLSGKVAVVTGASKGIGLAITRSLVAEGVSVAAGARDGSDQLSELASRSAVHPVLVDLTTPDGPARLIEEAVRTFGGLDILVNNVGAVRPRLDGFLALTDDDWDWALTINFLAAVRTTRAALPHLLDRAPATIVTVSSVNAFLPDPAVIDYSAAKGALTNFCKSLSKEFGPRGVRVNTRSALARSRLTCGSATTESPPPLPRPATAIPKRSPNRPSLTRRPAASLTRKRSPTWCCC